MGTPVFNRLGQIAAGIAAQVPLLGIAADKQCHIDIRQAIQQAGTPLLGAALHRRQVSALCVIAGKAESHRDDGNAAAIIELHVTDPHPRPKANARWIIERRAGLVRQIAGSLTRHKDARTRADLEHRIGCIRHVAFAQSA